MSLFPGAGAVIHRKAHICEGEDCTQLNLAEARLVRKALSEFIAAAEARELTETP